jgi:hypothetical protein
MPAACCCLSWKGVEETLGWLIDRLTDYRQPHQSVKKFRREERKRQIFKPQHMQHAFKEPLRHSPELRFGMTVRGVADHLLLLAMDIVRRWARIREVLTSLPTGGHAKYIHRGDCSPILVASMLCLHETLRMSLDTCGDSPGVPDRVGWVHSGFLQWCHEILACWDWTLLSDGLI